MRVKRLVEMLAVVLILTILSGCGESSSKAEDATNKNFIAIVGNHAGSLVPNYSTCESAVRSACRNEGNAAIIVVDGQPALVNGNSISIPKQQKNLSASKKESIVDSQTDQIMKLMETSYAHAIEVDLLKAFKLCSREVKSSKFADGSTEIYVYDAGVNTSYFNMTALDLENVKVEKIIPILREKGLIPDLSGLKINWYNISDTDYEISEQQAQGIKTIWQGILEEAGASVEFYTDPSTRRFDVELPYVSQIPYSKSIEDFNADAEKKTVDFKEPIGITESQLGFKPGKASFVDAVKADDVLCNLLNFLREHEDINVLIAATTADWSDKNYQLSLSEKRASMVKEFFASAGISEERLKTAALGSFSKFYKPDKGPDGSLNEEEAVKNRCIYIMDINCEKASLIKAGKFERSEVYGS